MNDRLKNFDVASLFAVMDAERRARQLTWKEVAIESGVSASTLTRISRGRRPDVDSLAALTVWLGVSADQFMSAKNVRKFGSASSLARITSIIRNDPHLNTESAVALEEMIKSTYDHLRTDRTK